MTLNCTNIDLRKGSKGETVKELQTILKNKGYYDGRIDGDFGTLTEESLKKYQKKQGLLADGIFGPVTCKKLQPTNSSQKTEYTRFTNSKLCEKSGGNCLGQITGYHCGPHSIKQCLRRFGITKYTEKQIGQYAGTTTKGTGHGGLETALAKISKLEGINLSVEWKNFSDLGSTTKERFHKYGDLMTDENKAVFHHELYRNQYGHYSVLKQVDTNTTNLIVANSLGSKCNAPAYCGYMENRSFNVQQSYLRGISQKSICIITKK